MGTGKKSDLPPIKPDPSAHTLCFQFCALPVGCRIRSPHGNVCLSEVTIIHSPPALMSQMHERSISHTKWGKSFYKEPSNDAPAS